MSGSRGEANFVWRCKNCKREHSASIKEAPRKYEFSEPKKRQTVMEMDCRGLEFMEFRPEVSDSANGMGWHVQCEGGQVLTLVRASGRQCRIWRARARSLQALT